MTVSIGYQCFASGEPVRLPAKAIWSVAAELRGSLFGPVAKPLDVSELMRRTGKLSVNGRTLRLAWDAQHPVHDFGGVVVLGACEHDPAEPGTVMISLNAEALTAQPELLRSTAAHELGHAVFDMPAAAHAATSRCFRSTVAPARPNIDWKEWRADEFMGAFLAPPRRIARLFVRHARAHGVAPRWHGEYLPTPFLTASSCWEVIDGIAGAIAEELGLSSAFIAVRLRKYEMIR